MNSVTLPTVIEVLISGKDRRGTALPFEGEPSFMQLLNSLYEKDWVVYCKKPFKTPHYVVKYLSRYTHKIAIYDNRLLAMDASVLLIHPLRLK